MADRDIHMIDARILELIRERGQAAGEMGAKAVDSFDRLSRDNAALAEALERIDRDEAAEDVRHKTRKDELRLERRRLIKDHAQVVTSHGAELVALAQALEPPKPVHLQAAE